MSVITWQHRHIILWLVHVKTNGTKHFRVDFLLGHEAVSCLYSLQITYDVSSRRNPYVIVWPSKAPKVQENWQEYYESYQNQKSKHQLEVAVD